MRFKNPSQRKAVMARLMKNKNQFKPYTYEVGSRRYDGVVHGKVEVMKSGDEYVIRSVKAPGDEIYTEEEDDECER